MSEKEVPADLLRRVLTDGDIELRPLVARDAGELFLLTDSNRAELRRYMTWVDRTTAVADMSYYILTLDGFWKCGLTWAIIEAETLIGTVGFHHSDLRNNRTEIGYWLGPAFQGRGVGRRAVHLALQAAFQYTNVHRIEAKIHPKNRASLRLVDKLGFTFEGTEREGIKFANQYVDHRVYSLLRTDPKAP